MCNISNNNFNSCINYSPPPPSRVLNEYDKQKRNVEKFISKINNS